MLIHCFNRLIPLASVVTPATLSVIAAPSPESHSRVMPSPGFKSLNSLDVAVGNIHGGGGLYPGPSAVVTRIAQAVAAQGATLPIPAPALNASWELNFMGPSLECSEVDDAFMGLLENKLEPIMAYGVSAYTIWHGPRILF